MTTLHDGWHGARLPLMAVLTLGAALGCRNTQESPPAYVVLELPSQVRIDALSLIPEELVSERVLLGRRLSMTLPLQTSGRTLRITAPGACPLTIETRSLRPGQTLHRQLTPLIDVGPPRPELGFRTPFKIEVKPGCSEAKSGKVIWRQLAGTPLSDLKTTERGFVLQATTQSFAELFGDSVPVAQLAVSPRTSGRVVLEASFTHPELGAQTAELQLSAVSRSRGLPNVPTDASVLLGGTGWQLSETPTRSTARLTEHQGYSVLRPQAAGKWLLRNDSGVELALFSAPYNHMPLDCGRSNCHQDHTDRVGRMSDVMLRGLSGKLGSFYSVRCTLGCHSLGEPGLHDGGFLATQEQLGFPLHHHVGYDDLPATLKRLSNVGCLGCHGPGAIPEPNARFGILNSAVCAYCHDAPPRYGHVAAWQQNRMSQAHAALDSDQQTDSRCARCHTTWGFLGAQGDDTATRRIEPTEQRTGINCVACHAVHRPRSETGLLRGVELAQVDVSLSAKAPTSESTRICLYCHAPSRAPTQGTSLRSFPEASAAVLWLGRGGYAESGEPLSASGVHSGEGDGCLTCHAGSDGPFDHGSTHSFRATQQSCKPCHQKLPTPRDLEPRARRLLERLAQKLPNGAKRLEAFARQTGEAAKPAHATPGKVDVGTPLGRAAYNLLLVLEDPAAGVHNPSYAELLLDHAERMME